MNRQISIPTALRIYELGIRLLLDISWVEIIFRHQVPNDLASDKCPKGLLHTTTTNGLLHYLGERFFQMLFNVKNDSYYIDVEDTQKNIDILILTFIASGLEFIEQAPPYRDSLSYLISTYDEINEVLSKYSGDSANKEFKKRELQDKIYSVIDKIEEEYKDEIIQLQKLYAANFAERIFHDRQYCEYISYAISSIYEIDGFPILDNDIVKRIKYIDRQKMPSWVFETLRARERDKCASCGKAVSELNSEFHIDHIIPISKFGTNDVVNLQLLCEGCNLQKTNNYEAVASSVPKYFSWKRSMK